MAFLWILLLLLVGNFVSTIPTVDRYITELPLPPEWDLQMMSDQTYNSVPPSASAYVYQIEDPTANYIFSANDHKTRDHDRPSATKPKFTYQYSPASDQLFVSSSATSPLFAPFSAAHFHLLSGGGYDVSPYFGGNILHTFYHKPVYIVNNDGLNLYNAGPNNIYESYVVLRPTTPVIYGGFPKLDHRLPQVPTTKKPPVVHATVVETNLTKINIDPITEPKTARKVPKKLPSGGSAESGIIHKRRAYSKNPYGIIYHKISTDAYYL